MNVVAEASRRLAASHDLLTSGNWEALAHRFEQGTAIATAVAGVSKSMAARDPDKRTKAVLAAAALAAAETAIIAAAAAKLANEMMKRARAEEGAKAQAQREQAARERAERIQNERLKEALDRGWHEHQERLRTKEFIREYRDTPIREHEVHSSTA